MSLEAAWARYGEVVREWLSGWMATPMKAWPPEGTEVVFVQVLLLEGAFLALGALAWWAMRRGRPRRTRPGGGDVLRALLLAVAIVALGAQVMETSLRSHVAALAQPQWLPHPLCLWIGPPNTTTQFRYPIPIHFNDFGLRERVIPLEKEPGEYRILMTGDSHPFGQGVRDEQMWHRVLEDLLQARHPDRKITVINQGMPGYSLGQSYWLYDDVGRRYDPDLVIVGSHRQTVSPEELHFRDRIATSFLLRRLQVLAYRSITYLLIRKELARWRARQAGRDYTELWRPDYEDPEATRYLWSWLEEIRRQGMAAVFVGPMNAFYDRPTGVWQRDHLKPFAGAIRPDEPILLVEWLREMPMDEYTLSEEDRHFSVAGHRQMAEQFARYIEEGRLIERTPPR